MRKTVLSISVAAFVVTVLVALAAFAATPPNLAKALEAQRALVAENPNDPQVLNDLGNLLILAGSRSEAESAYRRALEIAPGMTSARYNLGLLLYQADRPKEALAELERVVEAEPDNAWALYQVGAAHDVLGAEDKAVKLYARAFRLDPQLAFPEVNPHVIDNQHLTRAMLQAYRDLPVAGQAPKSYEQPGRIVSLMIPPTDETPARAPAEAQEELEGLRPRPSFAPIEGAEGEGGAGEADAGTGRTLREEDLESGESLNQVLEPGAVHQPAPRGGSRQPVRTPSARQGSPDGGQGAREPDGQRGGQAPESGRGAQERDPDGRQRFVPGLPSTGRLEIELVPGGADEPAPAG